MAPFKHRRMHAKRHRMRLRALWWRIDESVAAVNRSEFKAMSGAFADVEKFAAFIPFL